MLSNTLYFFVFAAFAQICAAETTPHAAGAEGSVMGLVAFLWPADRPWSADADNVAPCGSTSGPSNRTLFPLANGAVSLSIAEPAYQVAFRIAYDNEPLSTSDFQEQIVHTVDEIDPGHQCYRVPSTPDSITAGTNATIQLEYWSNYENGPKESFYACADVTLVEASSFQGSIPCFNVTTADFENPTASPTPSATSSKGGLSAGTKAGIAIGTIVGFFALFSVIAFVLLRRRSAAKNDAEANQVPVMGEKQRAASLTSGDTRIEE